MFYFSWSRAFNERDHCDALKLFREAVIDFATKINFPNFDGIRYGRFYGIEGVVDTGP